MIYHTGNKNTRKNLFPYTKFNIEITFDIKNTEKYICSINLILNSSVERYLHKGKI